MTIKTMQPMRTIRKGCRGKDVRTLQELLCLYVDGIFGQITEEAVKTFQKENGLVADGVVGAKTWDALERGKVSAICGYEKSKRTITEIIIHCTATPEGKNYTVDDIRRWHIRERGFSDIGYHYVVYLDGSVHNGRNVNTIGAHCLNHNSHSIGIAYVGGVSNDGKTPKDTRTPLQKAALLGLIAKMKALYPKAKVYGHREFANKACPSFDVKKEYRNI